MDLLGIGFLVVSTTAIMSGKGADLLEFGKNAVGSVIDLISNLFNGEDKNQENELNQGQEADTPEGEDVAEQDPENEEIENTENESEMEENELETTDNPKDIDETEPVSNKTENEPTNAKENKSQAESNVTELKENDSEQIPVEESSIQVLKNNECLQERRSNELTEMMSEFGDSGLFEKVISTGSSILSNYDIEKNECARQMANYLTTVGGIRVMDGDTVLNEDDSRKMLEGQLTDIANNAKSTSDFIEKSTIELERRVNSGEYKELMDVAPKSMAIYDVMKYEEDPDAQKLYTMYARGLPGLSYKNSYLDNLTSKFMQANPRMADGTEISEDEMRKKIFNVMDTSLSHCVGNTHTKLNFFFNISKEMEKSGIELSTSDRYRDVSITDRKAKTKDFMLAESDGKIDSFEQAMYQTNDFKGNETDKEAKPVEQSMGFTRF